MIRKYQDVYTQRGRRILAEILNYSRNAETYSEESAEKFLASRKIIHDRQAKMRRHNLAAKIQGEIIDIQMALQERSTYFTNLQPRIAT